MARPPRLGSGAMRRVSFALPPLRDVEPPTASAAAATVTSPPAQLALEECVALMASDEEIDVIAPRPQPRVAPPLQPIRNPRSTLDTIATASVRPGVDRPPTLIDPRPLVPAERSPGASKRRRALTTSKHTCRECGSEVSTGAFSRHRAPYMA